MVKVVQDVQFFGINGKQVSATMGGGLELKETSKGVQVTSKAFPGQRFVIYSANIAHVQYKEVQE